MLNCAKLEIIKRTAKRTKKYLRQNKKNAEIAEDTKKVLRGEPVDNESENAVQDVPDKFKQWMEDNRERMDEARKRASEFLEH